MSVNKVILVGHVGADPEVRYLEKGVCVARLRLATTERGYTATNGTEVPDRTEWHSIVLWRGLAEIAEKYVRKGSQIFVEGKLRTSQWQDQAGVTHQRTEIVADSMELLGARRENNAQ
ncbi:MAG: single-stranded DNA-binding protein [Bacteroidaceae bacterium]|jgi:single-strand DNA-binding protein|nr:single-stranded DNA-binding protein [Bacteroidaceae bacterium]MBR5002326.1 single-stranded DNA-binding protein [Bacteroidaceae bacterium]